MVAVHKLTPNQYEDYFDLIAIHCGLEDYALAYALNLNLKSNFKRCSKDLDISDTTAVAIFEWKEETKDRYWSLFTNKGKGEKIVEENGLFKEVPSFEKYHMVVEHREVDYFLKIEQDGSQNFRLAEVEKIIASLLKISKIVTAYSIKTQKLKSKNNLIF